MEKLGMWIFSFCKNDKEKKSAISMEVIGKKMGLQTKGTSSSKSS